MRGDLAAVWAAILLDDEARGMPGLTQPEFGKLREPMVRLVQWGRTFGATSANGTWKIPDLSNPATQLGQSPLRSPSVFNFFRPGYVPPCKLPECGSGGTGISVGEREQRERLPEFHDGGDRQGDELG